MGSILFAHNKPDDSLNNFNEALILIAKASSYMTWRGLYCDNGAS